MSLRLGGFIERSTGRKWISEGLPSLSSSLLRALQSAAQLFADNRVPTLTSCLANNTFTLFVPAYSPQPRIHQAQRFAHMSDLPINHSLEIYKEDDDASIVVPFQYADSARHSPSRVHQDESTSSSNHLSPAAFSPSNWESPSVSPDTDEVALRLFYECSHLCWPEACGALRNFGSFSLLPLELQIVILEMCGPSTLLNIRRVSHFGRLIGVQDRFWQKLYIFDFSSPVPLLGSNVSWFKNYRHAYNCETTATIQVRAMGMLIQHYHYSHNILSNVTQPGKRWVYRPSSNVILLPTMATALWMPSNHQLRIWNSSWRYEVATKQFFSGITMVATYLEQSHFPPASMVRGGPANSREILIKGRLPMPLLMVLVFAIE